MNESTKHSLVMINLNSPVHTVSLQEFIQTSGDPIRECSGLLCQPPIPKHFGEKISGSKLLFCALGTFRKQGASVMNGIDFTLGERRQATHADQDRGSLIIFVLNYVNIRVWLQKNLGFGLV